MGRLSGLPSFVLVLAMVFTALRLVHVVAPIVYPAADPGPHAVETPARAAALAGFSPWLPSYRPQRAGAAPGFVVTRFGSPRIVVEWRGERLLRLTQAADDRSVPPPDAVPAGEGNSADAIWERGGTLHALARRGEITVRVETDLSRRDLERVLLTLREVRR